MKCLFIINPSSGTKTIQKNLDQLIGQLILKQIVHTVDIFYTPKKDGEEGLGRFDNWCSLFL